MKTGTFKCEKCGWLSHDGQIHMCNGVWGNATGVKADAGKPRYDLIDSEAMDELAKVLTFGATKYAAHNWRSGLSISRLVAAALRHLFAFMRGESCDPETGLSHVAHAMCNCMFIIWIMKHKTEMDDRHIIDKTELYNGKE